MKMIGMCSGKINSGDILQSTVKKLNKCETARNHVNNYRFFDSIDFKSKYWHKCVFHTHGQEWQTLILNLLNLKTPDNSNETNSINEIGISMVLICLFSRDGERFFETILFFVTVQQHINFVSVDRSNFLCRCEIFDRAIGKIRISVKQRLTARKWATAKRAGCYPCFFQNWIPFKCFKSYFIWIKHFQF